MQFISSHIYYGAVIGTKHSMDLDEDLIFDAGPYGTITVPKGFQTDGASIPRWAWSLVGHPFQNYRAAAAIHDYLWKHPHASTTLVPLRPNTVDYIFRQAMHCEGVGKTRRGIMWCAVRVNRFFIFVRGVFP